MAGLIRIIIHWTAGGADVSAVDREHYHWIVPQEGSAEPGRWRVEANISLKPGAYAAHTLNCNTGAIGVALCGMRDAVERPFSPGPSPITTPQVIRAMKLVSGLCRRYKIPVTRRTVLTHAEVQPTLGIAQKGKWDIRWLPGMTIAGDALRVGDHLRAMVEAAK